MAESDKKKYKKSSPWSVKRCAAITPSSSLISPPMDGIRVSADANVTCVFENDGDSDTVTLALKAGVDYAYCLKKVTTVSTGTAHALYLV